MGRKVSYAFAFEKLLVLGFLIFIAFVTLMPGCSWWEKEQEEESLYQEKFQISEPAEITQGHIAESTVQEEELFRDIFARFKESKDYGEIALQNVVDLLDHELKLVRLLSSGRTGAAIDSALDIRNERMQYSSPSIVFVYNKIMDLVTYDYLHSRVMLQQVKNNKRLSSALSHSAKKAFLLRMEEKLMQYQKIIRQFQHERIVDTKRIQADRRKL